MLIKVGWSLMSTLEERVFPLNNVLQVQKLNPKWVMDPITILLKYVLSSSLFDDKRKPRMTCLM
jgi:hypothetical protein